MTQNYLKGGSGLVAADIYDTVMFVAMTTL